MHVHAAICDSPHHTRVGRDVSCYQAALEQVPPLTFLFLRFLLGTAVVFSVIWISGRSIPRDRFTLRISLIATVWLFLGYVLQTVGLRYTSASNSAFSTALYIVFVPLYLKRLNT